jgi:aminoglycoside/choline kinase family phosphotransferase
MANPEIEQHDEQKFYVVWTLVHPITRDEEYRYLHRDYCWRKLLKNEGEFTGLFDTKAAAKRAIAKAGAPPEILRN